jgi:flagellar protein FlaG
MEGINQIMKIPEAATNAAARSRPQSLQAQAAVETAAESQAVALAQPVPAAEVKQAAAELDKALQQQSSDLSVSVDETTGTMVVRITDSSTGEVVKQIPPKQLMEANVSMNKIVGLLIDDQG